MHYDIPIGKASAINPKENKDLYNIYVGTNMRAFSWKRMRILLVVNFVADEVYFQIA